jgi:hypothetical protein
MATISIEGSFERGHILRAEAADEKLPGQDETDKDGNETLPLISHDEVEAGKDNGRPQGETSEGCEKGPPGFRQSFHRVPQAAKIEDAQCQTGREGEKQ